MNDNENIDPQSPDPIPLPIEGELDLHTFNPRDLKELIPAYLEACRERSILKVRIVHGKGIGNLRRTVHALLDRMPEVASYTLAGSHTGGWGATLVQLHPLAPIPPGENG